MNCSPEEVRHIAHEAGRAGAHEALESLGVDVSSPEAREAARKDFQHMRDTREGAEATRKIVKRTVIVLFLTGLASVVIAGVLDAVHEGMRLIHD